MPLLYLFRLPSYRLSMIFSLAFINASGVSNPVVLCCLTASPFRIASAMDLGRFLPFCPSLVFCQINTLNLSTAYANSNISLLVRIPDSFIFILELSLKPAEKSAIRVAGCAFISYMLYVSARSHNSAPRSVCNMPARVISFFRCHQTN